MKRSSYFSRMLGSPVGAPVLRAPHSPFAAVTRAARPTAPTRLPGVARAAAPTIVEPTAPSAGIPNPRQSRLQPQSDDTVAAVLRRKPPAPRGALTADTPLVQASTIQPPQAARVANAVESAPPARAQVAHEITAPARGPAAKSTRSTTRSSAPADRARVDVPPVTIGAPAPPPAALPAAAPPERSMTPQRPQVPRAERQAITPIEPVRRPPVAPTPIVEGGNGTHVEIGNIEVRLVSPSQPAKPSAPRRTAASIARPLTSAFGLRQM